MPSNEGRGYVLRRILRRAVRYGQQMLGAKEGFFAALVPSVASALGGTFPELLKQQAHVQAIIAEEEGAFSSMLARGIKEFNGRAEAIRAAGGTGLDGEAAFFLYDSMGFPLDLTQLMAREAGLTVDTDGFAAAMERQKARSAAAAQAAKGGDAGLVLGAEQTAHLADSGVPFTDDEFKYLTSGATGATLRAIYTPDGFVDDVDEVAVGTPIGLVLDRTAFYAEAGGQVADVGALTADSGAVFDVTSVQSFGGFVLHAGTLKSGALSVGDAVTCGVDYSRRADTSNHHTVTHMMNYALQQVLGDVSQKGSLCDDSKARFDFTHNKAMSAKQCAEVEAIVQEAVRADTPVHTLTVPLEQAMSINGLRAVFGERYPDPVRVVSIGPTVEELVADPDNADWAKYSIELCGGNHIEATSVLEDFALVEETAVAKGVRRVVGVTGAPATEALATGAALQERLTSLQAVDAATADVAAIEATRKGLADLKRDIDAATTSTHLKAALRDGLSASDKALTKRMKQLQAGEADRAAAAAVQTAKDAAEAGEKFVVLELDEGVDGKAMQPLVRKVIKEAGLPVLAMAAGGGRVSCFAAVPDELSETIPANTWLQAALAEVDGKGGGKAGQAQGSGSDVDGVPRAVEVARAMATEALAK